MSEDELDSMFFYIVDKGLSYKKAGWIKALNAPEAKASLIGLYDVTEDKIFLESKISMMEWERDMKRDFQGD